MPKIQIEQKRPLDATPERALAMHREGQVKQVEIARLWGISPGRVSKIIKQALEKERVAKLLVRAQQIAQENENAKDSLH